MTVLNIFPTVHVYNSAYNSLFNSSIPEVLLHINNILTKFPFIVLSNTKYLLWARSFALYQAKMLQYRLERIL